MGLDLNKEDLWTIPVKELRGLLEEHVIFGLKDGAKLTEEDRKRLWSRLYGDVSQPVNADELQGRLRNISPRRSRSASPVRSSPRTPSPPRTEEEAVQRVLATARSYYDRFVREGGRPSRPIEPDPSAIDRNMDAAYRMAFYLLNDPINKCWPRVLHSEVESERIGRESLMWSDFGYCRRQERETPERFSEYRRIVDEDRRWRGLEGPVDLHVDPARQSKLTEWKEYQAFVIYRLRLQEKRVRARQQAVQRKGGRPEPESDYDERMRTVRYAELVRQAYEAMLEWMEGQLPIIAQEVVDQQAKDGASRQDDKSSPRPEPASCAIPVDDARSLSVQRLPPPSPPSPPGPGGPVHQAKSGRVVKRYRWAAPAPRLHPGPRQLSGKPPHAVHRSDVYTSDPRREGDVVPSHRLTPPCSAHQSPQLFGKQINGNLLSAHDLGSIGPGSSRKRHAESDDSLLREVKQARLTAPSGLVDNDNNNHNNNNNMSQKNLVPTATSLPATPIRVPSATAALGKPRESRGAVEGPFRSLRRRRCSESDLHLFGSRASNS